MNGPGAAIVGRMSAGTLKQPCPYHSPANCTERHITLGYFFSFPRSATGLMSQRSWVALVKSDSIRLKQIDVVLLRSFWA